MGGAWKERFHFLYSMKSLTKSEFQCQCGRGKKKINTLCRKTLQQLNLHFLGAIWRKKCLAVVFWISLRNLPNQRKKDYFPVRKRKDPWALERWRNMRNKSSVDTVTLKQEGNGPIDQRRWEMHHFCQRYPLFTQILLETFPSWPSIIHFSPPKQLHFGINTDIFNTWGA